MKREAILGLLAIVAICSVVFIAGCNERHTPTPTSTPTPIEKHIYLGDLWSRSGHYKEAAEEYREAIRLDPNEVDAYAGLGNSLFELKRYNESKREYEIALRLAKEQGKDQQAYALENLLSYLDVLCNPHKYPYQL